MSNPKLALLMMVKNEHLRIKVSLDSCLGIVDSVVVLDTGSTDNTVQIIQDWCKEHNMPLYLKQTEFKTFCESRNESLDFLDTTPNDYAVLLDCNDEIQNGAGLRKFINEYKGPCTAFHVCQIWWNGFSHDKYYNVRLMKVKGGWRYKRTVHEYASSPQVEAFNREMIKRKKAGLPLLENTHITRLEADVFVLYQDRTKDDDKSSKRFARDKVLLMKDYVDDRAAGRHKSKDDEDIAYYARTLFYLAQTLGCLMEVKEAYRLYRERVKYEGFTEEVFHAYYRTGECGRVLHHTREEIMISYLKAIFYSHETFLNPRVEPYIRLSDMFIEDENYVMAYNFLNTAIYIPYPEELILFVDKNMYDYSRYNLMAKVCYRIGKVEEGFKHLITAIKSQVANNRDISKDLLLVKEYTDEEYNERWLNDISGVKLRTIESIKYSGNKTKINEYIHKAEQTSHFDNKIVWLMKALSEYCKEFGVASIDIYLKICETLYKNRQFKNAMLYAKLACELSEHESYSPESIHYRRFHWYSKLAYKYGNINMGRITCLNAIVHGNNNEDIENLSHYVKNVDIRGKLIDACKARNQDLINMFLKSPDLMEEDEKKILSNKLKDKLREKVNNRLGKINN